MNEEVTRDRDRRAGTRCGPRSRVRMLRSVLEARVGETARRRQVTARENVAGRGGDQRTRGGWKMEPAGMETGRRDRDANIPARGLAVGVHRSGGRPQSSWLWTGAGVTGGTSLFREHIGPVQGTCDGMSFVDREASARSLSDIAWSPQPAQAREAKQSTSSRTAHPARSFTREWDRRRFMANRAKCERVERWGVC